MSSASEHHKQADQLLAQARTEKDATLRRMILAEAQVHATLALGDPGEMSPASRGQDQAADTKSAGAANSGMREGGGLSGTRPPGRPYVHRPPGRPFPASAPGGFPSSPSPEDLRSQSPGLGPELPTSPVRPAAPEPAANTPWQQQPRPAGQPSEPARPARRQPAPDDPGEEELDDPGEEEPGGPKEPKPGGPEEPKPGGFTPFSF